MPELPEVEIVKLSLKKTIKSKKILKVKVNNRNLRFKIQKDFEALLKRRKIIDVNRKAKYLIIILDDNKYLIMHFGMSGTLHLLKKEFDFKNTNLSFYKGPNFPSKHNHIELFFDKFKIVYNDPRRFGFVKFLNSKKELVKYLKNFGMEPLEKKFNIKYLKKVLNNKNKNIKNILLDQKYISGIGNIYANEILFFSKINPNKLGKKINIREMKKLLVFSKKVLRKAIKKGGSTIRDFKNAEGTKGSFQDEFKVYNKDGFRCPNSLCAKFIKKITISNRSSFYCPDCQK